MVPKMDGTESPCGLHSQQLQHNGQSISMGKVIAVALGGAAGSIGRYAIALLAGRLADTNFPLGTFIANIGGCLLIGIFWSWFDKNHLSNEFRLFLFTGFLGGFTTFSTFARESMQFFKAGEPLHAFAYILASNIIGIAVVAAGFFFAERFFRL